MFHLFMNFKRLSSQLTISNRALSADNMTNISNFLLKNLEIQIFIAIFGFSMKNAFKWVQTSLL